MATAQQPPSPLVRKPPTRQNGEIVPVSDALALTPAELLRIAVSQNADVEKLSRLMDLQERWERNEARKSFVAAMNAFKAESPRIVKNRHVHFDTAKGPNDYNHATLDHVCDAVIGALSKHGISHRWKVEQCDLTIKVTCVLTHAAGHAEETSLQGAPDQTGSKNSIQAVGSTVTYLQRYTLLAATGLAAANSDPDGRAPNLASSAASTRVGEMLGEISRAASIDQLWKIYKFAYREAEAAKDHAALDAYIQAKDARKAELKCQ
jgi:hypothetical protein